MRSKAPRARGLAAVLLLVAPLVAGCGGEEETTDSAGSGSGACAAVEAPPPPKELNLKPPGARAPTASGVAFETSCGGFTVEFDPRSPRTAASFQYLAERGAFDDTVFHRVVKGQLVQGGDPLGTDPELAGSGGPGYSVDERPPGDLAYTRGTVAMAKTVDEPIGRSGSQFFIVTAADAGLTPDYALVGTVTEGMETVDAIDALGVDAGDGPPSAPVVVESAVPEGSG